MENLLRNSQEIFYSVWGSILISIVASFSGLSIKTENKKPSPIVGGTELFFDQFQGVMRTYSG